MTDILFAEDDAGIREWTALALEGPTCRVRAVADGAAALKAYEEKVPDLAILDVMMPKVSGWDMLTEIRKKDKSLPIMMLTAKAAEADKVMGLGLGADDYLAKPFGVAELRARVAALLRRAAVSSAPAPAKAQTFAVGSHTVDPKRSVVIDSRGKEADLTSLELGILNYLAAHRGEIVTRDSLLAGIWGNAYQGTNRTIDTRLAKLRQKLGADAALVETVYGAGYRLK